MPVIPGLNEGQVLNAGSPVPIASPEEARMQGNAVARLGGAATELGDTLNQLARAESNRRLRVDKELASQSAEQTILGEYAGTVAAAPIEGDRTGAKQIEGFYQRSAVKIEEQAALIEDPDVRAAFTIEARKNMNEYAKDLFAKELVKRSKQTDTLNKKAISGFGQMARHNPKDTELLMQKAELYIEDNPDIPASAKAEQQLAARKQVLTDSVNGLVDRRNYEGAISLVEKFGGGVYTSEEKDKRRNDITTARFQDVNRELGGLYKMEEVFTKNRKKKASDAMSIHTESLKQAGTDPFARAPIIKAIENDPLLSADKKSALKGEKSFSKGQDDLYDSTIMKDVIRTGDYQSASEKIFDDRGSRVSPQRASEMVTRLNSLKEKMMNDPNFTSVVKTGEKYIRAQANQEALAPMSNAERKTYMDKVERTVEDYYKQVTTNPKVDAKALATGLVRSNLDTHPDIPRQSVGELAQTRDRIVQETLAKKQQGRLTREEEREATKKLQGIHKRMLEMDKGAD